MITKMESLDAGSYVTLAQMYGKADNLWPEISQTMNLIQQWSWVEVDNKVHVFSVVSSATPTQSQDICPRRIGETEATTQKYHNTIEDSV
ncbi:pentatricopeptide repeat-containing protein [Corchorus olitorius]|uniref:Pentatricopeptide repeat-containing protein n=1 Tax=Corchorus olitorius TaxID=93759 RepID=A0A1R3K3P0_9ROSI|nr:pentatricopeptide repeat-containing protein [Corchorus olitorius]